MTNLIDGPPGREALETMVAEADTGGRKPTGLSKTYIFVVSLAWALFQLWYASPLPYKLHFGVVNDGQARIALHQLGDSEVCEQRPVPVQQDVVRFDIAMDDALLVCRIQRGKDL